MNAIYKQSVLVWKDILAIYINMKGVSPWVVTHKHRKHDQLKMELRVALIGLRGGDDGGGSESCLGRFGGLDTGTVDVGGRRRDGMNISAAAAAGRLRGRSAGTVGDGRCIGGLSVGDDVVVSPRVRDWEVLVTAGLSEVDLVVDCGRIGANASGGDEVVLVLGGATT